MVEIRVEDFKYSSSTSTYKGLVREDAVGTTSFQLPVYALLARERLREQGARIVEDPAMSGRYVLLRDPARKVQELLLSNEILDPGSGPLFRGIAALVEKAGRGAFHPDPLELRGCDFCSYRALCRFWSSGAADRVVLQRDADVNDTD